MDNHSIAKLAKEKVRLHLRGQNLGHSCLTYASGKYSIQSRGICYRKILVFACNDF